MKYLPVYTDLPDRSFRNLQNPVRKPENPVRKDPDQSFSFHAKLSVMPERSAGISVVFPLQRVFSTVPDTITLDCPLPSNRLPMILLLPISVRYRPQH